MEKPFVAASMLISINDVPMTNEMLAKNRIILLLNFGNADCNKPKVTPVVPIKTKITGFPILKFPKKYKLVLMRAIIAPTINP